MQVLEATCVVASDKSRFREDFPHLLDVDGVRFPLIPKHFPKGRGREGGMIQWR